MQIDLPAEVITVAIAGMGAILSTLLAAITLAIKALGNASKANTAESDALIRLVNELQEHSLERSRWRAEQEQWENERRELRSQIDEITQLKLRLKALEEQIEQRDHTIIQLQSRVKQLESQGVEKDARIEQLLSRVQALENEGHAKDKKIAELEKKWKAAIDERETLERHIAELRTKIGTTPAVPAEASTVTDAKPIESGS